MGTLEFQPGERYKHVTVNITDNSVPELEKTFKVELLNPERGGKAHTSIHWLFFHDLYSSIKILPFLDVLFPRYF